MENNSENKYICKYCGREFINRHKYAGHISNIHKNKKDCFCNICGKQFSLRSSLTHHINYVHLKIIKPNGSYIKIKCNNCGRRISITNFKSHYKSCINEKKKLRHKDIQEILDKCIIKNNKYICPICNKEYSKMGIGTHIWRKHTKNGQLHNPNINYKNGTRVAWNKGLTKETDSRIVKGCITHLINKKLGKHKLPKKRNRVCTTSTKYGWYKGIYCDSSWELAFLIYCLDHNKKVMREERGFEYIYNNKMHKYYPDFLVDNTYYEIKGRDDTPEITKIKLQTVKDLGFSINILYRNEIKKYIKYVKNKYNINKVELLYDKDKKNNVFH